MSTDEGLTMRKNIEVEVVFASTTDQVLLSVSLPEGATIAEAVSLSGIAEKFPDEDLDVLQTGIWGHPRERTAVLTHGDRVEIYRPLLRDPREARRELAQAGLTMREASDDK